MLKDHLGSASLVVDASGQPVTNSEQRYYPFGEKRLANSDLLTDKLYTGQREMEGLGIYHYGARFYSPTLGRFLSPDTIIPGAGNPQAFNRYSYGLNNPSRYTDPTGHRPDDGCRTGGCSLSQKQKDDDAQKLALLKKDHDRQRCKDGNENYCSTAETHPVELAAFTITSLVTLGTLDYLIAGGGAASVADAGLWRAAQACIGSAACRWVTGMAGGAGYGVNQTDYYVTPNGQAIPSTGYRYSAGSGFNTSIANGTLPARADGTYFTFESYVEKTVAKSSLQMPYLPEKGVSFDTLQIIDDIHVPYGMYGTSSVLEPITTDFPQFGAGGATQVITYSPIQTNGWWWLK